MLDNLNNSKHEFNLYKQIFLPEDFKSSDLVGPSPVENQKFIIYDFRESQNKYKAEIWDNLQTMFQVPEDISFGEETGRHLKKHSQSLWNSFSSKGADISKDDSWMKNCSLPHYINTLNTRFQ